MIGRLIAGQWVWYGAALLGTFLMGSLGVFVRQITPGNEYAIALGRFSIGLACLMIWQISAARNTPTASPAPVRLNWGIVGSGVFLALFVACYFKSVQSAPLAIAAFLLYLGPLVASGLAAITLGEGFDRTSGLLLGGALLGMLFITEFQLPDDSAQAEGLIFGALSGVFYGLFLLFNNAKIQRCGSTLTRTAYQFIWAAGVMLPFVIVSGVKLNLTDLLWIAAIGVLHGFLALTLVIAALGQLRTIEYGTISYNEPVTAAVLGVILYAERISALQIVGCMLVLVAGLVRIIIGARTVAWVTADHPTP